MTCTLNSQYLPDPKLTSKKYRKTQLYFMTHLVLLSLTTVTGVFKLPIISLQSSVMVKTCLGSVYNMHSQAECTIDQS